jgi:hypothetical protein
LKFKTIGPIITKFQQNYYNNVSQKISTCVILIARDQVAVLGFDGWSVTRKDISGWRSVRLLAASGSVLRSGVADLRTVAPRRPARPDVGHLFDQVNNLFQRNQFHCEVLENRFLENKLTIFGQGTLAIGTQGMKTKDWVL